MTAFHFVRPGDLVALALTVIVFASGGVAHATVFATHPGHSAPPSGVAAPVRAHTAVQHAAMVAPRRTPSGPVRAHSATFAHFASFAYVSPSATMPRYLATTATVGRARFHPVDARSLRMSRLVRSGVPGPLRARPTRRSPASEAPVRTPVRWPAAAGAHPVRHAGRR
jgi:hypothetical protein